MCFFFGDHYLHLCILILLYHSCLIVIQQWSLTQEPEDGNLTEHIFYFLTSCTINCISFNITYLLPGTIIVIHPQHQMTSEESHHSPSWSRYRWRRLCRRWSSSAVDRRDVWRIDWAWRASASWPRPPRAGCRPAGSSPGRTASSQPAPSSPSAINTNGCCNHFTNSTQRL